MNNSENNQINGDKIAAALAIRRRLMCLNSQRTSVLIKLKQLSIAAQKIEEHQEDGESGTYGADECPICLDKLFESTKCVLGCNHKLHTHCVLQMRENGLQGKCPICRGKMATLTFDPYLNGTLAESQLAVIIKEQQNNFSELLKVGEEEREGWERYSESITLLTELEVMVFYSVVESWNTDQEM